MADERVLVVGAGISGLALARALRKRDVPYVVMERHARAGDAGPAINLPGNAVRALTALGLRDGLESWGARRGGASTGRSGGGSYRKAYGPLRVGGGVA
ncbi:NAD(P)-binding protein [Actinoplanes sp. Pm04-4]|uniref:NAD(P)-binding protein n=1 Tax=Paractinoplanes pyxinae TaxID=2997416 RepID=A0ABT4AYB0_9ACTN|nr:NAD(P)-binding protein [Actinoplanes pyxinae]MCY1139205.1 NAD(P)-binding protein [Actinoplanes pyxinae]